MRLMRSVLGATERLKIGLTNKCTLDECFRYILNIGQRHNALSDRPAGFSGCVHECDLGRKLGCGMVDGCCELRELTNTT